MWSASTTMRNPERAIYFLRTIAEIEGENWNEETQIKYQILLIRNRYYKPTNKNLKSKQISILDDLQYNMTYEEAKDIFYSKNYTDGAMRGRTSFDPIEKLGLAFINSNGAIKISSLGKKFINEEIALEDVVFNNLLKFQLTNPLTSDCKDYNTKPFINILRLIKKVNLLCNKNDQKAKGVSRDEFGIFCLSIKNYNDVDQKAQDLLEYRHNISRIDNEKDRNIYRTNYVNNYLSTYENPVENTKEYTDNIVRYLRMTKYIYIRGGGYFIDLEPRRNIEIESLLEKDNGSAHDFTKDEYIEYLSNENSYELPFETQVKLVKIGEEIVFEINKLNEKIGNEKHLIFKPEKEIEKLKKQIENLRNDRELINALIMKKEYEDVGKIDNIIYSLNNIRDLELKPSIALEKWTTISLNAIDDALAVKSNAPLGDDYEPVFTAPAGVSDIECYYTNFGISCEVTMLTGRDQWFNEGQPVMRHLRNFENKNSGVDNYCIFIAPSIHQDTLNTFWNSVKYEYEGKKQKIIPLTIEMFIKILNAYKNNKINNKTLLSSDMQKLYEECCEVTNIKSSSEWYNNIKECINRFSNDVL